MEKTETLRFLAETFGSVAAAKSILQREVGERYQMPLLRHRGIELTIDQVAEIRTKVYAAVTAIAEIQDTLDQTGERVIE